MQRCKYLDDLGLDITEYGTNFIPDDDGRAKLWAKQREEYEFDDRETWFLDMSFIEWIYTRLMMYKEVTVVNLSFYKITYNGQAMTQGEVIDRIIELAKEILTFNDSGELEDMYKFDEIYSKNLEEICLLWKDIAPRMTW